MRYRLTRADRLRGARAFRGIIHGGSKTSGRGLSLFVQHRHGRGQRLGIAIAGRLGGAVTRNRIRRRLREFVRLHRNLMPEGLDLVVVVHRDVSGVDPNTFRAIAEDLFWRAGILPRLPPQHARASTDSSE